MGIGSHEGEPVEVVEIGLHFSRADLDGVLSADAYRPENLVDLFARRMTPALYGRSVGAGRPLRDHVLHVLRLFDHFFARVPLPAGTSPELFRLVLTLHDIGYAQACRERQHEYTPPMVRFIMERLQFDSKSIELAVALVSEDPIGGTLQGVPGLQCVEDATDRISALAKQAGISASEFFELLLIFYTVDAGSYKHLQHLMTLDATSGEVVYAPFVRQFILDCRDILSHS